MSKNLGCFIDNVGARKLYEYLGFKLIKQADTHCILFDILDVDKELVERPPTAL